VVTCENIRDRLHQIIVVEVPDAGRFKWLEDRTGIPRTTWNTFWRRDTAIPSGDMIQAIARLFPCYAFWLASGYCDSVNGHLAPEGMLVVEITRHSSVKLVLTK
jgi:hypothetical protein